jgi:predicted dehydrogenase
MNRLKLGYVGAGYLAQRVHLPNLVNLENIELVALAEIRPKLARQVQERFRIPTLHADHLALAKDPGVQAVALSGHFAGQGELAREILLAGKDVFMEKPMAVSVAQADAILAAEKSSGKRLMVGYMKRYDAGNLKVKALVDGYRASGEMGPVTFIRNHGFCGDWIGGLDTPFIGSDEPVPPAPRFKPDWMPDARYDHYIGYLQQYTHNVNLVRWLMDAGKNITVRHVDLDPARGYAGVVIFDVAGVTTILESGGVDYHGWDEHTQVYFQKGWVRTQAPPLLLRGVPASVEVYRSGKDGRSETTHLPEPLWTWSYKEEMRHFAESVMSGTPFRSPAADAAVDVRTFEDIYRKFVATTKEA